MTEVNFQYHLLHYNAGYDKISYTPRIQPLTCIFLTVKVPLSCTFYQLMAPLSHIVRSPQPCFLLTVVSAHFNVKVSETSYFFWLFFSNNFLLLVFLQNEMADSLPSHILQLRKSLSFHTGSLKKVSHYVSAPSITPSRASNLKQIHVFKSHGY